MPFRIRTKVPCLSFLAVVLLLGASCGGGGNGGGGGGGGVTVPLAPTGLAAIAGSAQVSLTWNVSSGATSYNVQRSTTSGGPYTQIGAPTATNYTDTGLTNGTTYYYVVSAVNSAGVSANSTEASATPVAPVTQVHVSVDTLVDRHPISPYVYGGAYPQDPAHVTDSGMTVVRWGGNATSTYNCQTHTYNADNDWYFSDYLISGFSTSGSDPDSTQFIKDVINAGSNPLMTMVMMEWVSAASSANSNGELYSFSVATYGPQCETRPDNADAGDGLMPGTNCLSNAIHITENQSTGAYVPLLDTHSSPCTVGCANSLYRSDWAGQLATAFNTSSSAQHFYDMDNEVDIWGSTHFDIHPNPTGYEELRDTFRTEATYLKGWDPAAVRLGPVSCCWWFYWNGANGNDKGAHGNIDQLPWFLNEVYWRDQIDGARALDVFDVHAYPDGPSTTGWTAAQNQALSLRIYRDYWDPTYVSESGTINQIWTTSIQTLRTIPFRIPRLRAMLNMIYPNTPLSMTEWSAAFAGESDFSTALADADAYGIIGREHVYLASRWEAPSPANPNYQALKLYRNYDGNHSTFGTTSISATAPNADPDLFSVYASLSPSGTALKLMIINKDPANRAQAAFALNHFTASAFTAYTLSQASPSSIVVSAGGQWSSTQTFPPYSATLLVIAGSLSAAPASEWDLNPDTIQVPAGGTGKLAPTLVSGAPGASVTLQTAAFNSGYTAGGTLTITQSSVTAGQNGAITVSAGTTPGFYQSSVTGVDGSGVTQTKDGWIVIGNPSATLTNNNTPATGAVGTQVTLSVTLNPGLSIGSPTCGAPPCPPAFTAGASVLFTVNAGSLSGGVYPVNSTNSTMQQIAVVDGNGHASVNLTLPVTSGAQVNVTAEGPYALGHPVLPLTIAAQ